jgi:hypothetical protein
LRIVHAITYHGDRFTLKLQLMDEILFVIGHGIGHKTHDTQTAGHGRSCTLTVSRKHAYLDVLDTQFPDSFHRSHPQLVLDGNNGK